MVKIEVKKSDVKIFQKKLFEIEKDFSLEKGLYRLTGDNGSGKSVFLEYLAGFREADFITSSVHAKKTLFLGEIGIGLEDLTVLENIKLSYKIFGAKFDEVVLEKIRRIYTEKQLQTLYSQASFGMQLMVGLSLLFSSLEWELIILDETLSGIDKRNKEYFFSIIESKKNQAIFLLVSHDFQEQDIYFKEVSIHEGKTFLKE